MSDNKLLGGSICVTDLIDAYQKGHSGFSRSDKNQKVYVNVKVRINDEPDQYNNNASIQLNSHKDKIAEDEKKFGKKNLYIGNLKFLEKKEAAPIADNQRNDFAGFGGGAQPRQAAGGFPNSGFPGQNDDLPF